MEWQTENKYTCCLWAGGAFFQLCCCVSFLVSGRKLVLVLVNYISWVQYSCGVLLVFWFWGEILFGITYVFSVQYTCVVVSVFWLWWAIVLWQEIVLKMRTPFDFLWAVSTKKSCWVTLLWSDSWCVYFIRPNTLLLCIFLFCIFLLYRTYPQVEVQIRILLEEAALVSKMQTPAITLWFTEHRFKKKFNLGFFIKEKWLASQVVFLVKCKHWVLVKIWFFVCLCFF